MQVTQGFWRRVGLSSVIFLLPCGILLRDFHIGITPLAAFTASLIWSTLGEMMFAYHGDDDA